MHRIALSLSLFAALAMAQKPTHEIVESLKDRVVCISALDKDGEELSGGTGFIVKGGKIATNAHVLEDAMRFEMCWDLGIERASVPLRLVLKDEERDLAILEPTEPVDLPEGLELAADGDLKLGEEVLLLGFPAIVQPEGEGYVLAVFKGVVSALRRSRGEPLEAVVLDALVFTGSSGGPVYSPRLGKVIAVTVAIEYLSSEGGEGSDEEVPEWESVGVAIPPSQLAALLKKAAKMEPAERR